MNILSRCLLLFFLQFALCAQGQIFIRTNGAWGTNISNNDLLPFKSCFAAGTGIEFQRSDSSFVVGVKTDWFFLQPEFDHFDIFRRWQWGLYLGKSPIPSLRQLRISAGMYRAKSKFTIKDDFFPHGVQNTGPSFFSQWAYEVCVEYRIFKNLSIQTSFNKVLPRRYATTNKSSTILVGVTYALVLYDHVKPNK